MHARIAEEARAALRRHVVEPLASRCVDREHGGFLVDFDEQWRLIGPHDKTLEHASRTTLVFAMIDRVLPGEGLDQLVRHGCAFLQQALWDAEHGGFFVRVDRSGRPAWEGLKHPHAVTYAAQAFLLAAPHLAPGEGEQWARRALGWLDEVAWDPAHGGYWGSYRRDNERYPDMARLPTPDGLDVLGLPPGFKEINTLGDAIETLTAFVALGTEGRCAERLAFLVDLVVDRLSDSQGVLPYLCGRDWRPVPDLIRIGQNFQMIHRLVAAAALTGATAPVTQAADIADFCLERGRHPAGGFCFAVSAAGRTFPATGPSSDSRLWWVQLEAVHAFHALASHAAIAGDARERYARARDEAWSFTRDHFFDDRFGGLREFAPEPSLGWEARLRRWLRERRHPPPIARKTHGWKDPFHEVCTFLALRDAGMAEQSADMVRAPVAR